MRSATKTKPECDTDTASRVTGTARRYTDTGKVSHKHSQSAMQAQPSVIEETAEFDTDTVKVHSKHDRG
ncbi:MAG TPA: hypothetical protein VLZ31_02045 [Microbacteriaceae bacterium]|nr:hypothetical protein [Microbacteriaceae bacterium]